MAKSGESQTEDIAAEAPPEEPKLLLDLKIEERGACQRHVTVTVPRSDIDRYFKKEFDEIKPTAAVPGFRPGRAPRKLMETRFKDQVSEKIKSNLVMDSLSQISAEKKFAAISEPDFDYDAVKIPDEGPMIFEFNIEVRPEFALPEWRGLKLELPELKYGDEEVDRHLRSVLMEQGVCDEVNEPAQAGDVLRVDIDFWHGDEMISSLEDCKIPIRPRLTFSDGALEGFDKLALGAKPGDKFTGKFKLSDDCETESLQGKEVEARFEVGSVIRFNVATAEAWSKAADFPLDDMRKSIREAFSRQSRFVQLRRLRDQVVEQLLKDANWELPQEMLRRQMRREVERLVSELQSAGFSNQEILARQNELRRQANQSTARALHEHFLLERIAEDQGIEATPEEFDLEIAQIAAQQRQSIRSMRAQIERGGMLDSIRNQIIERKVLALIEHAGQVTSVSKPLPPAAAAVDHAVGGAAAGSDIPEAKHGEEAPLPKSADRP